MTDKERFLRVMESRSQVGTDSTFAMCCLLTVALAEQAGVIDDDLFRLREQLELGSEENLGSMSEFPARARALIEGVEAPTKGEHLLLDLIQPVEGHLPKTSD